MDSTCTFTLEYITRRSWLSIPAMVGSDTIETMRRMVIRFEVMATEMITVDEAGRVAWSIAFDRLAVDSAWRSAKCSPGRTAMDCIHRHSDSRASQSISADSRLLSRASNIPSRGPAAVAAGGPAPGQTRHSRPVIQTRSVLWDSSAILALLDADDEDHAQAVTVARQIASEQRPSFITNYIEAEAHALVLRKLGRAIARQWLLTGGLPVVRADAAEEQTAKEIFGSAC